MAVLLNKRKSRLCGAHVTWEYLERQKGYKGWPWHLFCEKMLRNGFYMRVKKSNTTESVYVSVSVTGYPVYKIRFSCHRPSKASLKADLFVGPGPKSRQASYEEAFEKVYKHFKINGR